MPGAGWLLRQVPDLLGFSDDPAGFSPVHPGLAALAARYPGLRIGRSGRVFEALVPAVLEQKVVGIEANRAWKRLLSWHGTPAPGPAPAGLRVFPPAGTWQRIPSWDWHQAGVEGVRAATITGAARVAGRLERICSLPGPVADRMLQSLPGIGPWTSAEVRQRACGDADAVSVGDYHLPSRVGWALAGTPADDDGMLDAARALRRAPAPGGSADRGRRRGPATPRAADVGPGLPEDLGGDVPAGLFELARSGGRGPPPVVCPARVRGRPAERGRAALQKTNKTYY